jgi:Saxitoxin biosynthesis operon protein SxtJ
MKRRAFRAEREFGIVVGSVLILLASWWLYRGKFGNVAYITLSIGLVLFATGVVFPRLLVVPNRLWMGLAAVLSYFSTRIILAVIFFLILTPIGLIKRAMGWDPLRRRAAPADSYWHPYSKRQMDPRHYEKMY